MTRATSHVPYFANSQAETAEKFGETPMRSNVFGNLSAHDFTSLLDWLKKLIFSGNDKSPHGQDDDQSDDDGDETAFHIGDTHDETDDDHGSTIPPDDAPDDPVEGPPTPTTGDEYAPDASVIVNNLPTGPGGDSQGDGGEAPQVPAIPEQTPTTGQEYLGSPSVYIADPVADHVSGDSDDPASILESLQPSVADTVGASADAEQGFLPLIMVTAADIPFEDDSDDDPDFFDCFM